jgi:hypothetical protein
MGLMRPKDLTQVATILGRPGLDRDTRRVLRLLRACLEHRFRHDVGIGHGTSAAAACDIELGGEEGGGDGQRR